MHYHIEDEGYQYHKQKDMKRMHKSGLQHALLIFAAAVLPLAETLYIPLPAEPASQPEYKIYSKSGSYAG